MKVKIWSLIIGAALIFVCGCKKNEAPPSVEGQIFATLNNGSTIKLSGVDVYICQREGFWDAVTPQITNQREEIKKLDLAAHEARLEAIRSDLPSKTRIALEKKQEAEDARHFTFLQANKWPGIIATVKTDADGKFTVNCPTNSLVVACTSRTVGGEQETMFWAVEPKGKLLLENSNMYILMP